jgi:hypothetical protein
MVKNKELSKRERKELKKKKRLERREKNRKEIKSKETKEKRIKYGALVAVLILAGFFLMNKNSAVAGAPQIVVLPELYDFGDVSITGGIVTTVMTVKNEGNSDLVINDMESSCGCTTASITKNGIEGPTFSMKMHGTNPVGWSETLKPGENAFLNINYNPMVHPLRGPVTREIILYSNDPRNSMKVSKIHVNQVD